MCAGASVMLRLDDICLARNGQAIIANAGLHVPGGTMLAILGPNGAGKTSLLQIAAGLVSPDSGSVVFGDGADFANVTLRARRIAYLPQSAEIVWPMACRDIVALGRLPHQTGLRLRDEDALAIEAAMVACAADCFADRPIDTLSGGEQARVMLARLLATQADILLLDEPLQSLDPAAQMAMLDVLQRQARNGRSVVVIMHDINLARHYCDHAVLMKQGRIEAAGPVDEVLSATRLGTIFGIDYAETGTGQARWLHPVRDIKG